jgi:hypothetical protein
MQIEQDGKRMQRMRERKRASQSTHETVGVELANITNLPFGHALAEVLEVIGGLREELDLLLHAVFQLLQPGAVRAIGSDETGSG